MPTTGGKTMEGRAIMGSSDFPFGGKFRFANQCWLIISRRETTIGEFIQGVEAPREYLCLSMETGQKHVITAEVFENEPELLFDKGWGDHVHSGSAILAHKRA